jgi:hypothetical protein
MVGAMIGVKGDLQRFAAHQRAQQKLSRRREQQRWERRKEEYLPKKQDMMKIKEKTWISAKRVIYVQVREHAS